MIQLTLDLCPESALATVPYFEPDLPSYDTIIVAFSGGKDSVAMVLDLLERGVPSNRIELWHHCIDGEEDGKGFMDWPATTSYCRRWAAEFGLKIYFSWRIGGFERELFKAEQRTAPVAFETPEGLRTAGGQRGKIATRRRWPALSPDLRVRWCSSTLKVDVMSIAINNQSRFHGKRLLVLTGERAAESANRARYSTFEDHRCHAPGARVRRTVHHWRPIHSWSEEDVWAIIRRWGVVAHPAYYLGFGRCSCAGCIFGSPAQWASLRLAAPPMFERIAQSEIALNHTVHRDETIIQRADRGRAYAMDEGTVRLAMSREYVGPIRVGPGEWQLPAGAFGEAAGPC